MRKLIIVLFAITLLAGCVSNRTFKAEKQRVGRMEFQQMKNTDNLDAMREEFEQNSLAVDQMMVNLEDELSLLREDLVSLNSGVVEMRGEFSQYAEMTDAEMQAVRERLNSTVEKIAQTETRIARINDQVAELNTVSVAQKAKLQEIEDNYDTSTTFNEDVIIDLDQRLEDLRASIGDSQAMIKNSNNDQNYDAVNQKLESMKLVLDGSKSVTTSEINTMRRNIETMEAELAVIGNDLLAITSKTATGAARTDMAVTSYNNAKVYYDRSKYEEAIVKLEAFVKANPDHSLVPNALYWIGESYYSGKNYQKAIREFESVVYAYPEHPKADDSKIKIAMSYANMGDTAQAASELNMFKVNHPSYANMKLVDRLLKRYSN